MTGYPADRHGVLGDFAANSDTQTVHLAVRRVPAIWETVARAGKTAHVVGDTCEQPPVPITGLYVGAAGEPHVPPGSAFPADVLAAQVLFPGEIAPAVVQLFVPRAAEINQNTDNRLAVLAHHLADTFTRHNFATLAAAVPNALCVVRYDLLTRLSAAFGSDADPVFAEVLPGAYRLLDLFLGRLCHLAGSNATVFLYAPHGAETEPGYVAPGFAALCGANIRQSETLHGATLYDIAPMASVLCGVPVAGDSPGRVWHEALHTAPTASVGEPFAVQQRPMPALVVAPPFDAVQRANRWNLAQVYFDTKQFALAAQTLTELFNERPERPVTLLLADSLIQANRAREAERILLGHLMTQETPFARFLLGFALLQQKRRDEGIAHLHRAEHAGSAEPVAFWIRLGYEYFRARHMGDARRAFEQVLHLDLQNASGYLGLAACALLRRDLAEAIRHAAQTVEREPRSAFAFLILGRAYQWQERTGEAITAYETALRLNPNWRFVERSIQRLRRGRESSDAAKTV